jgi:hypothetical protein
MKKILIERRQEELIQPSAEECRGWMSQGVAKYFKSLLNEKLEDLKDGFINGDFTGESVEESSQRNSEAVGMAQAYADIILTLEEIQEDEETEEEITS